MINNPHELTCILAKVSDVWILFPIKVLQKICFFPSDFSQPLVHLSEQWEEGNDCPDIFAYLVFENLALPLFQKPKMLTVKYGDFKVDYENTHPGMQLCVTIAGNQAWIPDLEALADQD